MNIIIIVSMIMMILKRCNSYSYSNTNRLNSIVFKSILSSSRLSTSATNSINNDSKVYVVNTSSRGIGLEFTKQILSTTADATVIALTRSSSSSLSSLLSQYSNRLIVIPIDLEDTNTITTACNSIKSVVNHVDVLINVAGILGDPSSTTEGNNHLSLSFNSNNNHRA